MRALVPLLLLAAGSTAAQSLTWIDLSGDWRIIESDDPTFAQPGFDDSAWKTVALPGRRFFRGAVSTGVSEYFFWLRRTVELPAGLENRKLALTLGNLTENYEVYWNGSLLGGAGDFTVAHSQIARPRTFDLPAGASGRVTISIRGWVHGAIGPGYWRTDGIDSGPYVLTGAANAPRRVGEPLFDRLRAQTTPDLVSSTLLLLLALIILLVSLRQRRIELLWLALFDAAVAYRFLQAWLLIAPETAAWASYVILGPINRMIFLSFLLAALRIRARWLQAAAWIFTTLAYVRFDALRLTHLVVLSGVTVGLLGWAVWRRQERRREENAMLAAAAALFAAGFTVDILQYAGLTASAPIGPYRVELHAILTAVFSAALVLDLTRRLLTDSTEKLRLANELEAAREIQQLLLPAAETSTALYTAEAAYTPASEVGGDFHWSRAESDGSLLLVVGDVSGKGLRAAMLVSVAIGILQNEASKSPAAVLAALNRGLAGRARGGFVTCCCALFDADGKAVIASAGHPAPYCDGREIEAPPGLPLGIVPGAEYA